ncbi:MAG TPA: hypothetical protein VJ485_01340 [archaeon]|nr:hypothetical protein [archaeon]
MGLAYSSGERREGFGNGWLASYPLSGFLEERVPPESYWWRAHRKRLKFYSKDIEFAEETMRDLKRVPGGSRKFRASSSHRSFLSRYEIVFIDEDGNSIEVPDGR